jgi:hypothetical protein
MNIYEQIGSVCTERGITYSSMPEPQLIDKLYEICLELGYERKSVKWWFNYNHDFIPDLLEYVPK